MMLVSVSALEYDPSGSRLMRQDARQALDNNTGQRRVSRTATLDGGCVIYDTGYAPADRTIRISTGLEHLEFLQRMVKLYSLVRVVTDEGHFIGAPQGWSVRDGKAQMTILVTEE